MTDYDTVERSRVIAAPVEAIRPWIVDFQRWAEWSPWLRLDPDQETRLSGQPSGVGAVYEWSGNRKAGKGRMEIMEDDHDRVVIDLALQKPFKSSGLTEFEFHPVEGGTEVRWRLRTPRTIGARLSGLVGNRDKRMGAHLEQGLRNLDAVVPR